MYSIKTGQSIGGWNRMDGEDRKMQKKACLGKAASEGRTRHKKRYEVLKGQGQKLEDWVREVRGMKARSTEFKDR